jgi:transcriptional regulator with XRE-family HTH domain
MAVKNRLAALIGDKQRQENRIINIKTISDESGVSRQVIYKWLSGELGTYDSQVTDRLCRYFGVDISELLYLDPPILANQENNT